MIDEIPPFLQPIPLNDLPKFSPWPARLLGLETWEIRNRESQLILREYGKKWGDLYKKIQNELITDLEELLGLIHCTHFPDPLFIHIEEQFYLCKNIPAFWSYYYKQLDAVISEFLNPENQLIELGCGWGRNLFYAVHNKLCLNAVGGEFTLEGLKLGQFIASKFKLPIEFFQFDYNDPKNLTADVINESIVFTHNSIEQIRHVSEIFLNWLIDCRPKTVIHFEPIYEYRLENSLIHYLWKRYTEVNDYNRNLLTLLKKFEERGRLKIVLEKRHALGLNALNPGSFIVWQPTP